MNVDLTCWNIICNDGKRYYAHVHKLGEGSFNCIFKEVSTDIDFNVLESETFSTYEKAYDFIFQSLRKKYSFMKKTKAYFSSKE